MTSVTDPEGRQTRYTYDDAGRLIELSLPPADSQQPTADSLSYQYDTLGNLRIVTDPLGHETEYVYDARYRLTEEIDANGDSTEYTYFDDGQLHTLTDAVGNTTAWTYDPLGRVASETNELNDSRMYEYDEFHRLIQMTDRNERVTEYDYDGLHRLIEERWLDGMSTVHTISYDYDQASQLTDVSDAFADYHYDYDDLGRATQVTQTIAGLTPQVTFDRAYDSGGLMTQTTATIGATTDFVNDYQYDGLGRLVQLTQSDDGGNEVADKRIDFTYNRASQFATIERYASLDTSASVVDTNFSYDGRGRLEEIEHVGIVTHGYGYDDADRLTSFTNSTYSAESATYTYDDRNQLTGVDRSTLDESYQYDDNGNREIANGSTYGTGADNRLTFDGTYTYAYDAEGNRIARFIDDGDGVLDSGDHTVRIYDWDHRNRLVGVSYYVSGSDALSGTNALGRNAYAYDPFNQWISRKVDLDGDFGSTPIEQTFFLWENGQIVLEFDKEGSGSVAAGDLSHRYLWGPAVDMLLADEQVFDGLENEGEVYWALTDHLGSVRDVVDNNGTLRIHRGYDAYGNVFGETHYNASGNVVTPGQSGYVTEQFSFTGKFFEVYIDQYYNWHRWYDPATGSWTSQDFIWDGANKYAYVGNEVTGYVDSNELERSGPWWNNDWTDEWNPYAWFVARGDDVGNTVSSWWYFSFENDQSRRLQAISMGRNGDPAANCPDDHRRHQRLGPISSSAASGLAEAYGEFASGVPALATGITVGVVIRNAHLAGRRHPVTGILFDADGFPDFSTVAARRVRVTFSGNYADDFAAANARAGFDRTPDGFTWHHHQDGTTMELVPTNIHQKTGHTGGMSLRQCEE